MKKILAFIAAALFCTPAFAVLQYEIVSTPNPAQPWTPANQITLKITEGGSLWFSSFVSNWYVLKDLGSYSQMTAGNYGAVVNGEKVLGTGESKDMTFVNSGGKKEVSTPGYYVGDFKAGDEIAFWVTAENGNVGSSVGLTDWSTGVGSRQTNTTDLAGNTRINFGFSDGSVEFVAIGQEGTGPAGQPLPGALAGLLVGGGVLGSARMFRRKKTV